MDLLQTLINAVPAPGTPNSREPCHEVVENDHAGVPGAS